MGQFKKNFIIAVVSPEENESKDFQSTKNLSKKIPDSIIIQFDPKKGFTEEQKALFQHEAKDLSTMRIYIDAHGREKSDRVRSLGKDRLYISADEFAKEISAILGPLQTSRSNPLHISLVVCYGAFSFGKKLQEELFNRGIFTIIKARISKVGVDTSGRKYTDGRLYKEPGSKVILYTDAQGQQQTYHYDYLDKELYNFSFAQTAIMSDDIYALKKYLIFSSIKYGQIKDSALLIKITIEHTKLISLVHLLDYTPELK